MRKLVLLVVLGILVAPTLGIAGDGGMQEFGELYGTIEGWVEGTLGKVIALSALAVGLGMGVVRQSVMACVLGVAMGITASYGPKVIGEVVRVTGTAADALEALSRFLS